MRRTPLFHIVLAVIFLVNSLSLSPVKAEELYLPKPGTMVHLSPPLNLPMLTGIKVFKNDPFRFDFILDQGDAVSSSNAPVGALNQERLKQETKKLLRYFLAAMTVPEQDLWVNLSPYEKDRIIPDAFGLTEMGRDLLAQDYMLKQVTASLIYPEEEIGKQFWQRVYTQAQKQFGTTNIPMNTFNKVWIVPENPKVYENAKAGVAYVVEAKLKVMLEEDYLSASHNVIAKPAAGGQSQSSVNALGSQIVREIVIPELTKEVNEGKNFAALRQVYHSVILAFWYKQKVRNSILNNVYANKNKIGGIDINDPQAKARIYAQYVQAFKKGVYNYIKEEQDPLTQQPIPHKYFSGGIVLHADPAQQANASQAMAVLGQNGQQVSVRFSPTATVPIRIHSAIEAQLVTLAGQQAILRKKAADHLATPSAGKQKEVVRALIDNVISPVGIEEARQTFLPNKTHPIFVSYRARRSARNASVFILNELLRNVGIQVSVTEQMKLKSMIWGQLDQEAQQWLNNNHLRSTSREVLEGLPSEIKLLRATKLGHKRRLTFFENLRLMALAKRQGLVLPNHQWAVGSALALLQKNSLARKLVSPREEVDRPYLSASPSNLPQVYFKDRAMNVQVLDDHVYKISVDGADIEFDHSRVRETYRIFHVKGKADNNDRIVLVARNEGAPLNDLSRRVAKLSEVSVGFETLEEGTANVAGAGHSLGEGYQYIVLNQKGKPVAESDRGALKGALESLPAEDIIKVSTLISNLIDNNIDFINLSLQDIYIDSGKAYVLPISPYEDISNVNEGLAKRYYNFFRVQGTKYPMMRHSCDMVADEIAKNYGIESEESHPVLKEDTPRIEASRWVEEGKRGEFTELMKAGKLAEAKQLLLESSNFKKFQKGVRSVIYPAGLDLKLFDMFPDLEVVYIFNKRPFDMPPDYAEDKLSFRDVRERGKVLAVGRAALESMKSLYLREAGYNGLAFINDELQGQILYLGVDLHEPGLVEANVKPQIGMKPFMVADLERRGATDIKVEQVKVNVFKISFKDIFGQDKAVFYFQQELSPDADMSNFEQIRGRGEIDMLFRKAFSNASKRSRLPYAFRSALKSGAAYVTDTGKMPIFDGTIGEDFTLGLNKRIGTLGGPQSIWGPMGYMKVPFLEVYTIGPPSEAQLSNNGGIDLTPATMGLQVKDEGQGIVLDMDPAQMAAYSRAAGFSPEIIDLQTLVNPAEFLGISSPLAP